MKLVDRHPRAGLFIIYSITTTAQEREATLVHNLMFCSARYCPEQIASEQTGHDDTPTLVYG
jgi:hypothetical protein